jgi:acyl-CoA synthetase (AMP-forming)/AMP-acid ligase II
MLTPDQRAALLGPGAPFELVTELVLGQPTEVFASRHRSLRALLDDAVAASGPQPFLVDSTTSLTYDDVAALVDGLAALLAEGYGVARGDRVAIVAANCPAYALLLWATVSLGAISVGLNGWWAGAELAYGVELARPTLVVGDGPRLDRLPVGAVPRGVPVRSLDELLDEVDRSRPAPSVEVDEDDPALILFTSGTTGRPKGAVLSHRNVLHLSSIAALGRAIGAATSTRAPSDGARAQPASMLSSPMFHVSGLAGTLASGPTLRSKLVFAPPGRWEPGRHLRLTAEHGISTWSAVPTQYFRLLHHPDFDAFDLRCLRSASAGGAPFPPELVREFHEKLPWVMLGNGYGMTETFGVGTLNAAAGIVAMPDSVGPAQPATVVEIRDSRGDVMPEGKVGEIAVRGPSVFVGYWDDPAATASVLDDARWYRSGDFGRIDHGFLRLESRMRDLIIRGGENVYPMEIEHRLVEHPEVDDAAVVGVAHPELGQEVKAFVVVRDGASPTTAEVQQWVADALAPFKVPAHVAFVDALPYNESGKVLKIELERLGAEGDG